MMSRSNYSDDIGGGWEDNLWRGAVRRALQGKRGQAFLREMLEALDALHDKALIEEELYSEGSVCAIGSVGLKRGIEMTDLDPENYTAIAKRFGIAESMVREIEYENDEIGNHWHLSSEGKYCWKNETPEERFIRVRAWVVSQIRVDEDA